MNAVKGLFEEGNGQFTRKDAPDFELARKLMHEKNIMNTKRQLCCQLMNFCPA